MREARRYGSARKTRTQRCNGAASRSRRRFVIYATIRGEACEEGNPDLIELNSEPVLDRLRTDARFAGLIRRIGFQMPVAKGLTMRVRPVVEHRYT
jgi:hypothetical protein